MKNQMCGKNKTKWQMQIMVYLFLVHQIEKICMMISQNQRITHT